MAGWSLSTHHRWDAARGVLVRGDGSEHRADAFGGVITTVAGNGNWGFSGDGGPATAASLNYPVGVSVAADGSLYIADTYNGRIRRVGPDGIITTVAGNGQLGLFGRRWPGDGGEPEHPFGVAVAADGSLYIADIENHRIRRVGPDGIITTVAGNGQRGFSGDGGPATAAGLHHPTGVAVAADGSLYIADYDNYRIRRVGPDGIITTVAGNGNYGFSGDGGPATAASLSTHSMSPSPPTAACTSWTTDYYNHRIRRVGPDGIITTVAGNGNWDWDFSGDGGPATAASLYYPSSVAVAADGSLYIADYDNHRIRRVGPDGIITTVAGNGNEGFSGDGGPATAASLY